MKNEKEKKLNLSEEFPAVSTRAWEDRIKEDLNGANYEKKLVWETHDRYRIRPYYRREDLGETGYLESLPGQFPYLRGGPKTDNTWLTRQDVPVKDPVSANREALEILEKGITSIGFELPDPGRTTEKDIHALLKDLPLEQVPVNFMLDGNSRDILEWFYGFVQQSGLDAGSTAGSVSLHPLGRLSATGHFKNDMVSDFSEVRDCLEFAREHLPRFRIIHNCGDLIHNAGASVSQELAFTLSMGNEYLVQLTGMGSGLEQILPHMQFQFPAGSSYFMEIAKLRAARFLWSRILEAYASPVEDLPAMYILSTTSHWNQTLYDPHVNMLRGTTASMSAILGGADSLTVTPFDLPVRDPNPFSERMARNTQIILKEESYLDKVIDPAAGSYYIENLTDTLITGVWDLFLQTEERGGYRESLLDGFIQEQVKSMALSRLGNYTTRRETLLGTNRFPILDEKAKSFVESRQAASFPGTKRIPGDTESPDSGIEIRGTLHDTKSPGPLHEEQGMNKGTESSGKRDGDPPGIEPLEPFRAAREFEQLRLKTEYHPGKWPVVFIIPLGNLAMRRSRAMFTMNFFACAGFRVIDNIGRFTSVSQGMKAAREAGADIVVLCSSDDEYPDMAADMVSLAGPRSRMPGNSSPLQTGREPSTGNNTMIPVIAGYPEKYLDTLKKAGVKHFIHAGSNVLEDLKYYQELLGI